MAPRVRATPASRARAARLRCPEWAVGVWDTSVPPEVMCALPVLSVGDPCVTRMARTLATATAGCTVHSWPTDRGHAPVGHRTGAQRAAQGLQSRAAHPVRLPRA